jgi:hypothetical protein
MKCSDFTFAEMSVEEQHVIMETVEKETRNLRERLWRERRKLDEDIMRLRQLAVDSAPYLEYSKPSLEVSKEELKWDCSQR